MLAQNQKTWGMGGLRKPSNSRLMGRPQMGQRGGDEMCGSAIFYDSP
jgi:hypothetical protein